MESLRVSQLFNRNNITFMESRDSLRFTRTSTNWIYSQYDYWRFILILYSLLPCLQRDLLYRGLLPTILPSVLHIGAWFNYCNWHILGEEYKLVVTSFSRDLSRYFLIFPVSLSLPFRFLGFMNWTSRCILFTCRTLLFSYFYFFLSFPFYMFASFWIYLVPLRRLSLLFFTVTFQQPL